MSTQYFHDQSQAVENSIGRVIIEAAIEVHRTLGGPGLLESIYEEALAHELSLRGMQVRRQVAFPVCYKGHSIKDSMRLDLLVNNCVIIEVKSTEKMLRLHSAQVLTYLRLSHLKLGFVLNFGLPLLKDGISRVVNQL